MADISIPTQQFVDVKEVRDGVLYLKSGGIRKILIVGGINFDLKSEGEQNTILASFQNFLNTIDFPIQLLIHSRKVNVESYLSKMVQLKDKEDNELLKIQIGEYINFIRSFVDENAIISKVFLVVVPYESASAKSSSSGFFDIFKKQTKVEINESENAAIEQLNHRVSEVTDGLMQVGLNVTSLNSDEITELFYNMYNPQLAEKKNMDLIKES